MPKWPWILDLCLDPRDLWTLGSPGNHGLLSNHQIHFKNLLIGKLIPRYFLWFSAGCKSHKPILAQSAAFCWDHGWLSPGRSTNLCDLPWTFHFSMRGWGQDVQKTSFQISFIIFHIFSIWFSLHAKCVQEKCGELCHPPKWDPVLELWRSKCSKITLHPATGKQRASAHESFQPLFCTECS